jgi:hypothetical protein
VTPARDFRPYESDNTEHCVQRVLHSYWEDSRRPRRSLGTVLPCLRMSGLRNCALKDSVKKHDRKIRDNDNRFALTDIVDKY